MKKDTNIIKNKRLVMISRCKSCPFLEKNYNDDDEVDFFKPWRCCVTKETMEDSKASTKIHPKCWLPYARK